MDKDTSGNLFDIIAGTSIGAIKALFLLAIFLKTNLGKALQKTRVILEVSVNTHTPRYRSPKTMEGRKREGDNPSIALKGC